MTGTSLASPTSLDFGPDGRLYVSEVTGRIKIFTLERVGVADFTVVATETLEQIFSKPNRFDDGTLDPSTFGRECTGILVVGTAANPVIYVASSDPRVAFGFDSNLDTNSGILTRLTWNGTEWEELDLVRGLPRCEENHASNGMALDPLTGILYLAQGGNTNMGAPANGFGLTPEYALSAAVLSVDLNAIGDTTYDLPTLDDPTRLNTGPGGADENDPFGGNDGANQAMWTEHGPVQVYAPGFRNPYDVLIHSQDRIYTIDNGANVGLGGPPVDCTNDPQEAGSLQLNDGLHLLGDLGGGPGKYGGHPNPFRGNLSATIGGQSPIFPGFENPAECVLLIPGPANGALTTWGTSTNGLCEYTAGNFDGAMQGDILTVGLGTNRVERVQLQADGSFASTSTLFSSVTSAPLDIVSHGPNEAWPGTIWVAGFNSSLIVCFEPDDLMSCTGEDSLSLDEDADGYSNADEIDNGSDPCSAGDIPPDQDLDLLSDLNDSDDDNDGMPDTSDPFAIDPDNGASLLAPFLFDYGLGGEGSGLFNLGFTGVMTNGVDDYQDNFVATNVVAGSAAGTLSIGQIGPGDALGSQNDQQSAFQLGVSVGDAGPFTLRTVVQAPYFDETPTPGQSQGVFLGTGDQDSYIKLALAAGDGTGALQVVVEYGGLVIENSELAMPGILDNPAISLELFVDPQTGFVQPSFAALGDTPQAIGLARELSDDFDPILLGNQALAVGVIATAGPSAPAFAGTWDLLEVSQNSSASADISIGPANGGLFASTFNSGSFQVENSSPDGQMIESVSFDLSTSIFPDMVFDPVGAAGDSAFKGFTPDSGATPTGLTTHLFEEPHDGGFDRLVVNFADFEPGELFTFSVDVDPTSITGSAPPGPNDSGSVSGLELAGTWVTLTFDDGTTLQAETWREPGSISESASVARLGLPAAPTLEIVGEPGNQVLSDSSEVVLHITGEPGANVRVLVAEGGLFVEGVPGGGFDIDPFEANTLLGVVEHTATLGPDGSLDLPVSLENSESGGGLNHLVCVLEGEDGTTGALSNVIVAEILPGELTTTPQALEFGAAFPGTQETLTAMLTLDAGAAVQVTEFELTGADFELGAAPGLPFVLNPGDESEAIEVIYQPLVPGGGSGSLLIHHDGFDSPTVLPLSGTGSEPSGVFHRINLGGPAVNAADGSEPWSSDTASAPSPFVQGSNSTLVGGFPGVADLHFSAGAGGTASLLDSFRSSDSPANSLRLDLPVPPNVFVEVRLIVAETDPDVTGFGQHTFGVRLGDAALDPVDPFLEAGGLGLGFARSMVVRADDGILDIEIIPGVGLPTIHAIEIREPGPLVISQPFISLSMGGVQRIQFVTAPVLAGNSYLLVSSMAGNAPGFFFDDVLVPVNADGIFSLSLSNANNPPFIDNLGTLGISGNALTSVVLPPGLPSSLAGLDLYHAGLVFDGIRLLDAIGTQATFVP